MIISRSLDNGIMCDCHWNSERDDRDLRKLLYPQPLRACIVNANQAVEDCCKDRDMGESIYYQSRGLSNDGSDFSDTSVSIACSTSTAHNPYDEIKSPVNGSCECHGCTSRYANETPRRRRRKVVTRSLVLDHGYCKSPQYNINNGFSDSGLAIRCDRNPVDSESSSSDCSNITPVRVPRRKPKTYRKSVPPSYYSVTTPHLIGPNNNIPYTWVSIFISQFIIYCLLYGIYEIFKEM